MARGIVWVRPRKEPANMMVAPNSPRARAQHSTAPASSAGKARGTVTRQNVPRGDSPRV